MKGARVAGAFNVRGDVESVGWRGHESGGRRSDTLASSRRDRRFEVDGATALKHPFTPWLETRAGAGEERSREKEEEEEAMCTIGRPKTHTLYRLVFKSAGQPPPRPMISSADGERSIPRFPQRLYRVKKCAQKGSMSPAHVPLGSVCLNYKAHEMLYKT
jgi:hypothetical protein